MLIEATDQPVRYRKRDGQELVFRLGKPIELPDAEATRLLERAAGKVRSVGHVQPNWLVAWRDIAKLSSGLEATDPRLPGVMMALEACDEQFMAGDFSGFLQAKDGVIRAMGKGRSASDLGQRSGSDKHS